MSDPSAVVRGPPPGGGGYGAEQAGMLPEKPGLLMSGLPGECDQDMLEYILYKATGVHTEIAHVVFSQNQRMAYVELADPATMITQLLSQKLVFHGAEIKVTLVDLLQVWKPYLIVQGFPPFVSQPMLEGHFAAEGNGSEIEHVELKPLEGQCLVTYKNPTATLDVASKTHEILGTQLDVTLAYFYSAPEPQEDSALTITFTGLPPGLDTPMMKQSLEYFFKKLDYNLASCDVVNGVAYITFPDPTVVSKVVSSPPTATFMRGCKLEYSTIPVSQIPTTVVTQNTSLPLNIPPPPQHYHIPGVPSPEKSLQPGCQLGVSPGSQHISTSPSQTSVHGWGQSASPPTAQQPQHSSSAVSFQQSHKNPATAAAAVSGGMPSRHSSEPWNPNSSIQMESNPNNSFTSLGFKPQSPTDSQTRSGPQLQDSIGSTSSVFSESSITVTKGWDPRASVGSVSSQMSSTSSQQSVDINTSFGSSGTMGQPTGMQQYPRGQWQPDYQGQPTAHARPPMFTIAEQPILGTSPQMQPVHQSESDMFVEDLEAPTGQPLPDVSMPTKIRIDDIPANERNETTLKLYLQTLLTTQAQTCSVKMHGPVAVATFSVPINLDALVQLASEHLYANKHELSFSKLEPSDTILVSGMKPGTSSYLLTLYIEAISGTDTVSKIEILSPTHALVTFKSCQCVQNVLSQHEHCLDGTLVTMMEYYPFMGTEEFDGVQTLSSGTKSQQPIPAPRAAPLRRVWNAHKEQLTKEKCSFVKETMEKLNASLETVKAKVTVEESSATVCINPMEQSSDVPDWDDKVEKILKEHLAAYNERVTSIPKEAAAEVYPYVLGVNDDQSEVHVYRKDEIMTIAGRCDLVDEVYEKISDLCESCQISMKEIPLAQKHVRFLERFCQQELGKVSPPVDECNLDVNGQCVCVTANPKGHAAFLDMIHQKVSSASEKTLPLTAEKKRLLCSKKGTMKIQEVLGMTLPQVVYDFEEIAAQGDSKDTHVLAILSVSETHCKEAKKKLKPCVESTSLRVSSQKIRVCSDPKWRELVGKLTDDNFALITVTEGVNEIVITGEHILIDDMKRKIEDFLAEHTSVEESVRIDLNKWKVMRMNFEKEIEGIKSQAKAKKVAIRWPRHAKTDSQISILIRGEPDVVDDIKVQVEMLTGNVHEKEERVAGVPAIVQVLSSIEDKFHVLETQHKAAIEVTLERGADISEWAGERPRKVCSATAQDGSKVEVFTGDFTQNDSPVGTIVSFITPDLNVQASNFHLLSSAGGDEVGRDFQSKVSQFMELKPNTVFKTKHGQLRCTQLLHCVLPPWEGGDQQNKSAVLEEALKNVLQNAAMYGSLLFTPVTSKPLEYPAGLFAQKFMDALMSYNSTLGSIHGCADLQAAVYVDELSYAGEFQQLFNANNFQIHTKVPLGTSSSMAPDNRVAVTRAKAISSPISSFISVSKGDMLQKKADVYINSTNSDLDLKTGQLSKLLLNACGDELQKECSAYAPLHPGDVAVTSAKNLNCNEIYHVALPDYKTRNSERLFRETVRKILRTANGTGVTSIAIPSLGVANLNYPANVSARILLDELIAFHNANPSTSLQTFHLVIFEKSTYQVFSKEFALKMSSTNMATPQQMKRGQRDTTTKCSGGAQVTVVQGNIADERTDVIVNTTTEDMDLSASAASRALSQKAGPNLQSVCKTLVQNGMKLEHGQVAPTNGFGLSCKKVLHAHVPLRSVATRAGIDHRQLIENIVTDCLQRAKDDGMQSISFPAFGLGQGGYTIDEVADPMLKAIKKFGEASSGSIATIRIVILDQKLFQDYFDFHCKFFGLSPAAATGAHGIIQTLKSKFGHEPSLDGASVHIGPSTPANVPGSAVHAPVLQTISRAVSNPVAVFHIFAFSPDECDRIANKIKEIIKQKAVTEKMESPIIQHLIDNDVHEIRCIGDSGGVDVRFMSKTNEIHISGEKVNVLDARVKITTVLNEVEKAERELTTYEWQSNDSGVIEPYSFEASVRLERARAKKLKAIEMIIGAKSVVIDLQSMTEIDKLTGKTREVERTKKKVAVDYPPTWEDEILQDGRPLAMQMFDVPSGSPEYQDAIKEFEATIGNLNYTIVNVRRVQNRNEYAKHLAFRDAIEKKHGKKVEQRRLFHGSKQESLELIAFQGFNRNFAADANAAFFGMGVYFAVNASYSSLPKYSALDSSGNQHMFVCNMIVGEYTRGKKGMKTAPPLTQDSKELFDTLVDDEHHPTIFVAMKDSQVYPEYLISFKVDRSKK